MDYNNLQDCLPCEISSQSFPFLDGVEAMQEFQAVFKKRALPMTKKQASEAWHLGIYI